MSPSAARVACDRDRDKLTLRHRCRRGEKALVPVAAALVVEIWAT